MISDMISRQKHAANQKSKVADLLGISWEWQKNFQKILTRFINNIISEGANHVNRDKCKEWQKPILKCEGMKHWKNKP